MGCSKLMPKELPTTPEPRKGATKCGPGTGMGISNPKSHEPSIPKGTTEAAWPGAVRGKSGTEGAETGRGTAGVGEAGAYPTPG